MVGVGSVTSPGAPAPAGWFTRSSAKPDAYNCDDDTPSPNQSQGIGSRIVCTKTTLAPRAQVTIPWVRGFLVTSHLLLFAPVL
jgi:hypothetical protein